MIKVKLFIIPALVLFSLALGAKEARACEPCTKDASMQFEETARNSDLIIIGQRDDFTPDELTHGVGGPEVIKLNVRRVLKGKESRAEITVKSWSGMCPYGIIINDNLPHIVFLKKSGDQYRAVDMCSVKDYLVKDNVVEFGSQKISLEDFELKLEKLGLQNGSGSGLFSNLYRIIVGGEKGVC
ncbi:MAG: hypothetical protein ICV60_21540 [Pyrinomonadaceae bacterium]|nr:hypothetical protein [Pyrinomonadaceae bacterium]